MTTTAAVQGDTITVTAAGITVELTVNEWSTDDDGVERPKWIARADGGAWMKYNPADGLDTYVSDDEAVHEEIERALRLAIVDAYRAAREDAKQKLENIRFRFGANWKWSAPSELTGEVYGARDWANALEWIEPSQRQLAADAVAAVSVPSFAAAAE